MMPPSNTSRQFKKLDRKKKSIAPQNDDFEEDVISELLLRIMDLVFPLFLFITNLFNSPLSLRALYKALTSLK